MVIAKAVVSILIVVALLVFLTKKPIERLWKNNKLFTIILGFVMGVIIGLLIYLFEKYWYHINASKPVKIMPFAIVPLWHYNWVKTKFILVIHKIKLFIRKMLSFHI